MKCEVCGYEEGNREAFQITLKRLGRPLDEEPPEFIEMDIDDCGYPVLACPMCGAIKSEVCT